VTAAKDDQALGIVAAILTNAENAGVRPLAAGRQVIVAPRTPDELHVTREVGVAASPARQRFRR
jgi:hypothetical protein